MPCRSPTTLCLRHFARFFFREKTSVQFSCIIITQNAMILNRKNAPRKKQARGHVGSEPAFLRYIITLGRHRRENTWARESRKHVFCDAFVTLGRHRKEATRPEEHGSMYFAMLRETRGTPKKQTRGPMVCLNHHKHDQRTINTDVSATHIKHRKNAGPERAHETP